MRSAIYFFKLSLFVTCLVGVVLQSGCKPRLLPSTNIASTRENKRVVAFLEQYKSAIEKRSVDAIMELVSKDFSDNMGVDDPALHLDYLALKDRLEKYMPRVQDIRLSMFVQHVSKLDKERSEVVFYFNKQVLVEAPSGEKWASFKEVSRMVIRRRHDKDSPYEYEILQGI